MDTAYVTRTNRTFPTIHNVNGYGLYAYRKIILTGTDHFKHQASSSSLAETYL